MVRQLSEMVASIRITVDTDYSRLCTIISLMDSCLCSEECLAHRPMQHLPELRQSFDALNHQIREVRGYNLMITKVFYFLSPLETKPGVAYTPILIAGQRLADAFDSQN